MLARPATTIPPPHYAGVLGGDRLAVPDFSKDCHYGRTYSHAHNILAVGLLVAGACAAALPLFVGYAVGLAFTYVGYILVAAFAYKSGTRSALLVGIILCLSDLAIVWPYTRDGSTFQLLFLSNVIAFSALSLGFGSVGRIAKDLNQIKFSDQLPRAADRDALLAVLYKELAQAKRNRHIGCLVIMEIEMLDKVEKIHGHHQMDLLLRQLQAVLVRQIRKSDTLAWLGGPYFALLLSATDCDAAHIAVNRLREAAQKVSSRSFVGLGIDASDWRVALTELKADDGDPNTVLARVASSLGPAAPRRIGLAIGESQVAF